MCIDNFNRHLIQMCPCLFFCITYYIYHKTVLRIIDTYKTAMSQRAIIIKLVCTGFLRQGLNPALQFTCDIMRCSSIQYLATGRQLAQQMSSLSRLICMAHIFRTYIVTYVLLPPLFVIALCLPDKWCLASFLCMQLGMSFVHWTYMSRRRSYTPAEDPFVKCC